MGLFDRLVGKKQTPSTAPAAAPVPAPSAQEPDATPVSIPTPAGNSGGVMPRLVEARKKLDARDVPAAVAIYEDVLATAGDRPDVLVTISGDLGTTGCVVQVIELIAPRYDAERHGPAVGINIVQAYLAVRDPNAAQHVLDLLFSLGRPELEDRLFGFSNAIADLMAMPTGPTTTVAGAGDANAEVATVALVTFSKPIWYFGLESLKAPILPLKDSRQRRLAFAQLALPGAYRNLPEALKRPEDELGRFSRGFPLWLAESFYFSSQYNPVGAIGLLDSASAGKSHSIFQAEWTPTNLQQLVDKVDSGLDYIFTGALRHTAGDYNLLIRVFEVKKFRERKTFSARWSPATADEELAKLHAQIRMFMEWAPEKSGIPAGTPDSPSDWIDTLAASASLFLSEKGLLPKEQLTLPPEILVQTARHAGESEAASLAFLSLRARAKQFGLAPDAPLPLLATTPAVEEARTLLGQ